MADDIETRLRHPSGIGEPCDHEAMSEAADTIARLRAALVEASRQLAIAYTILPTDTPRSAEARCIIQGVRADIDSSHKENTDG